MSALSFLHGIDTVEINDGIRPIRTLKSSIIGLVGTAGKGPLNTPTLIVGNQRDAVNIFGAHTSDNFSIPRALDTIFKQGGATVVVINVCNPATHVSTGTVTDPVTLAPNAGSVTRGFISTVTTGTAISAPYLVTSLGANRAFTTVVTSGGKCKFNVANPLNYTTGQSVTVVTSSVAGYLVTTTVLSTAADGVTLDVNYTATATGTITAALSDRVVLPTGATFVDARDLTTDGVIALSALAVGSRVKVNYTATLVANTDYTITEETGTLTRADTGSKLLPNATFNVTYKYVDHSLVTNSDVIGTVGAGDVLTGIEALKAAQGNLGVRPRLLIAPGYTLVKPDAATRNAVAVALASMAARLRATAFVAATNTQKESAIVYGADFSDERLMILYPSVQYAKPGVSGQTIDVTGDIIEAALVAVTDNEPGGGFWQSPSNRLIQGALGLSKPIDFDISVTETTANYLNAANISTFIRENGFRSWGNRMSDGTFITTRRTADMIEDSIAEAHRWAVDKNITKGYFAQLIANVTAYLGVLEAQGAILGGRCWVDPTLNTKAELMAGHIYVDYDFTVPTIAERITFRAHLVDTYITRVLPD